MEDSVAESESLVPPLLSPKSRDVDEEKKREEETQKVEGGGGGGLINNLISNFFHHGEGEGEEKEKKNEDKREVGERKEGKIEEGSRGIINNLVSHLPEDAAPATDEASILIHSIIHD